VTDKQEMVSARATGDASSAEARALTLRMVDDPGLLDAGEWNALVAASGVPTPFMRHEYLHALHASRSACAKTGWAPAFVTLEQQGELRAACPLYLKSHSYGEYVFDWAWADAYERHGLHYYPKLLSAVPFTPVPGARLLARDAHDRAALLRALRALVKENRFSSAHVLFMDAADVEAARAEGWMLREAVQFHWHNREGEPYADFDEFLASLQHDKRKKIRQERRRVAEAGVTFRTLGPGEIDTTHWDFFYRCYTLTYRAHHSKPYLTRPFFDLIGRTMAANWLLFVAERQGEPIAASLVALDPARRIAYGRYWGCVEQVPCLHFEACYYQPLAWCIRHGYQRFEGGAQGEHKMARGLLPVRTTSAHWLSEPAFAHAVAEFLQREEAGITAYVDELRERHPFRHGP
jgi:predicted N-acyltransferase